MSNYIIPLALFGLIALAYIIYMTVFYPKFKAKYAALHTETEGEWEQKEGEVLSEYFSNPNKFGLVSEAVKGENVAGMLSGKMPDSVRSKIGESLIGAITFTSKVDTAAYYLVATDKGLHYTAFDGDNCVINDVFDYAQISEPQMNDKTLSFRYKGEKISFNHGDTVAGYPRFIMHEKSRSATTNDRSTNYFVTEYLAYEQTENASFKQSEDIIPKMNTDMLKISKEKMQDMKVRSYLVNEFKKKLGV